MGKIRLVIVNQRTLKKWDKNWVYIGRHFSVMEGWDKSIGHGKRISLSKLFREYFEKERNEYLNWCEAQRAYNQDSLHWWMSHLAGGNNMSSFLYETICQIKSFKALLINKENVGDEILVVCENIFICDAVIANVQEYCEIELTYSYYKGKLYNWSRFFVATPIGMFQTLFHLFKSYISAFLSRKHKISNNLKGERVYLIHQCLDIKSFLNEGKLVDRYFSALPSWLEEKGNIVVRLPWLFNVNLPSNQIFKRIRQDGCLVIEDYLDLIDYYKAVTSFIKSIFSFSFSIQYGEFNLQSLLLREQLIQSTASQIIRFWLYGPALQKWSKELAHLTFIDTFEMMPPEHAQIVFLKKANPNFKFLGYYHSLVSRDFLGYWNYNTKMDTSILPDYIITNGKMGKKILVAQGFEEKKILQGPALRQRFITRECSKNKNNLMLLCPLDLDSTLESISKLQRAMGSLTDLDINIQVKAHPMIPKLEIQKKLPDNKLPFGWEWNDLDIADAIEDKYCCVILSSASVFDAIIGDCIVVIMQREFSAMGNFADILQDKFPILKEVPDEELVARIFDVFSKNSTYYVNEFEKIKSELLESINPVNDSTLKVFLNENNN